MLAFAPIPCNFLDVDPNKDFKAHASEAAYYQMVQPYTGGPPEPQVVHCGFHMRQPGSGRTVYTRSFLCIKVAILRDEWERRHAFFQSVGSTEGETTEDIQCQEGCRLKGKKGRHLKNAIEEDWERAAADAYTEFAIRLNRLAYFEEAMVYVTGFSSEDSASFTPDTLPLSLFNFPSVPGPDEPPTDRIDTTSQGVDLKSELQPGSEAIKAMVACVVQRFEGSLGRRSKRVIDAAINVDKYIQPPPQRAVRPEEASYLSLVTGWISNWTGRG